MDSRVRMALCPSTWISMASTPDRVVAVQEPSALSPMALDLEDKAPALPLAPSPALAWAAVREDSAPAPAWDSL